ncbi:MAG: nucleotidyl transferase AbiEii/AbiGii toxin family protein [Acidobacteria bacterium]|nr:nucleotidyl transferase AbiEii/AbiGii toxin family protein [Acidobacteriota bacterium]
MIPRAHIQEWAATTPWRELRQVEQDLIICRALCDIFNEPFLAERLAFRGGTAIHKLLFRQPLRYSEDIDLVQVHAEPIGPTVNALRDVLSWLGPFKRDAAAHSLHLIYRFIPDSEPAVRAKVKVEVNTREHDHLYGLRPYPYAVENPWFTGRASVVSFEPEELFGTKLRALLQRRKGRDLFDFHVGFEQLSLDPARVIAAFEHYMTQDGTTVSRANAEERMLGKLTRSLTEDIAPLLAHGVAYSEPEALDAFARVWFELVAGLKGEPWGKSETVIEEFRATSLPSLLRPTRA